MTLILLLALSSVLLLCSPLSARELLQAPPICDPFSSYPNQCFNNAGSASICCPGQCTDAPSASPACAESAQGIPPGTMSAPATGAPSATPAPTPSSSSSAAPNPTPTGVAPTPKPTSGGSYTGFPEFAPNSAADVSGFIDGYHPTLKFAVIGDVGRLGGAPSEGSPQCPTSSFSDDDVLGAQLQATTAKLLADECNSAKCAFIVNTGDNFYECGVYPGDSSRLKSDIYDVYNPYVSLSNLVWHSTLGNHDMVINGSMEQEMSFNSPQWYLPAANFVHDFSANGVSVRGIFYDENPWIANYGKAGNKYNKQWFQTHSNQAYADAVVNFVQNALATSTATHTFIVAHYPLFGSAVEYGRDPTVGLFNVFPRIVSLINQYKPAAFFNGHDHILTLGAPGNFSNGYTSYVTTGAGSSHGYSDACGPNKQYSNGGNGGFVIVEATTSTFTIKYYTTGPAPGSIPTEAAQCTVTSTAATKTTVVGADCAANTATGPADGSKC